MDGKGELVGLTDEEKRIEDRLEELYTFLTQPGYPGLKGGLIDAEGFPVGETEFIIEVRKARGEYNTLQNDLIDIRLKMEKLVNDLLRKEDIEGVVSKGNGVSDPNPIQPSPTLTPSTQPLCTIVSIIPGGLASYWGYKEGDEVEYIGSMVGGLGYQQEDIETGMQTILKRIRKGHPVKSKVRRHQQWIPLDLTLPTSHPPPLGWTLTTN